MIFLIWKSHRINMYILNIEKILETKEVPSWIHKAAFELKVNMYLPAGEYFEKLDDEEVANMYNCAKNVDTKDFVSFQVQSERASENLKKSFTPVFYLGARRRRN